MESASTARSARRRSANRPATGTATSRTTVPRPKSHPICSAEKPRDSKKRGMNGELVPKPPYRSA